MTMIEADDIDHVLDDWEGMHAASRLNDYFTNAAYPKTTQPERDAAILAMRQAVFVKNHHHDNGPTDAAIE